MLRFAKFISVKEGKGAEEQIIYDRRLKGQRESDTNKSFSVLYPNLQRMVFWQLGNGLALAIPSHLSEVTPFRAGLGIKFYCEYKQEFSYFRRVHEGI